MLWPLNADKVMSVNVRIRLFCLALTLVPMMGFGGLRSDRKVEVAEQLRSKGLSELRAHVMLGELSGGIGSRLNGSPGAEAAVEWGVATMTKLGFQNVRKVPCMVPHWVRGATEECEIVGGVKLTICALGNSAGTGKDGVRAEVIEVQTLKEAEALGSRAKGKVIFFNRAFNPTFLNTGAAYGDAGDQRFVGPSVGAKLGAAAVLVRSLTGAYDDVPHTGTTRFGKSGPIPAAALSLVAADRLSSILKANPNAEVRLKLDCETLPDVPSANVVGEIVGSEKPLETIVMGGHLDSWDKGRGAHDDGAGVVHGLEALRLIRDCGLKPKRTIRVVLWMNEENSGTGAAAYAAYSKTSKEKLIAAIESDSGGFAPRGFSTSLKGRRAARLQAWLPALRLSEVDHMTSGGEGGADVEPLGPLGAALFGLEVENQRYFDYHHSEKDTLDKVHPRELELGAISLATLAWLLSEYGA